MYLALDTASRRVSVALGDSDGPIRVREMEQTSSSKELLPAVASLLEEAGTALRDVRGLIAVRGPGSFTGIRIGLATILGFHQALSIPATGLGTLELVSAAARRRLSREAPTNSEYDFWGAVWALRDEWYLQHFSGQSGAPGAATNPVRWSREKWLARLPEGPCTVVGYGADELVETLGERGEAVTPPPLAEVAVELAGAITSWDTSLLTEALYVQGPSVTLPKPARNPGR